MPNTKEELERKRCAAQTRYTAASRQLSLLNDQIISLEESREKVRIEVIQAMKRIDKLKNMLEK